MVVVIIILHCQLCSANNLQLLLLPLLLAVAQQCKERRKYTHIVRASISQYVVEWKGRQMKWKGAS